jgi:CMP/dCMP kinase
MTRRLPTTAELRDSGLTLPRDAVVAIDGPAGSGKSTTARAVAARHGLTYIDTGAMYRALTLAALEASVEPTDGPALVALLDAARIDLLPGDGETTVHWDDRDVSRAVRAPAVDAAVSAVSAHAEVRRRLVERQRELGRRGGVVMEGRDIGTVVFPLATAKLYLDATLDARAERRWRQFQARGQSVPLADVREDLARRDQQDSTRSDSPLTISPDALVLDTSAWSLERQLEEASLACLTNVWLDRAEAAGTEARAAWRSMPGKYRIMYSVTGVIARLFRMRVIGLDGRVAPPGSVLASNHISLWDPPLVGSTFRRGPVRSLAKAELFPTRLGPLLRWMDAIPIRRAGFDRDALERVTRALAAGDCIFLFPEATRRPLGEPGPIKGALGVIAIETGADIVPIFHRGTGAVRLGGDRRAPLEVRYGPTLRLHALPVLRERLDRRELARHLGALYLAALNELQARSFAETPLSPHERAVQALQRQRAALRKKPFA